MKRSLLSKLIILAVLILGVQQTQSQNVWDGDNTFGNFTNCNNWVSDACPAMWNSTTDFIIQQKNNNTQVTMYLDYGAWRDVNNIIFPVTYNPGVLLNQLDADGGPFTENGLNFYGKLENYSPNNTHVFNLPFHGRNAIQIELNPINSGLTFNRPILNGGNVPYRVYGPNGKKLTINNTGYPAGNGSVSFNIEQYSIVEMDYNNVASLSGGYFVKEGELWINSQAVLQSGIQVGIGNANVAKLYISHISTPTTVANAITVPTNSPNVTIGSLNTSNLHTYSGTINLNNNDVNFDVVSAGGSVDFTNTISGTGGLRKINPGLVRLSGSSTYTGRTVVNQGTLQYGAANAIANTSNVTLNGGKFSTGATIGYSDTVGTLELTDNSIIELGTGNNILTFAASNLVAWTPGRTLTITGWTNDCAGAKVFVGNNNTGLTATQLAQITFQGYAAGASISPIGELIPGNIVLTATGGTLLANYATLRAAFIAINGGIHTGILAISVLNDTNEGTNTATLNHNAAMTSLLIQPGGCGPRTISGNTTAPNPMVDFSGADNVTVDGLNTNGNSLTITNTTVSATAGTCTMRFQLDATDNLITNCSVLGSATMAATSNGGNIYFGVRGAPTNTGNDNNIISNCNIGPAGANLPSIGIYFSGTPGSSNDNILIDNNNIYNFFSSTVASAGIDIGFIATENVSITNNRFYQTAPRTLNAAAIHSAIRIANTSAAGNGFTITGNTIGYANAGGTGTYFFTGTVLNAVFNPINLTLANLPTNSVQNNTIAGISHTITNAGFITIFNAINVTSGNVNIGNITGNTIGLPGAPITFNCLTAGGGGLINGINVVATGDVAIQNNIFQAISSTGISSAAFNFTGITAASTAVYTIENNTIGHAVLANSITLGSIASSALSTFTGINASATGSPLNIGANGSPNIIQNITMNATATNSFIGITTTGATTTTNITYNNIRGIRFAAPISSGSNFTGISNNGAITGSIAITNNELGILGTDLITYSGANTGLFRGITNTSAGPAASLSINANTIRGVVHNIAGTSNHTYISNSANCPTHSINSNTIIGSSSTGGAILGIDDSSASANKSIANNAITALSGAGTLAATATAISSSNGTTVNINTNTITNISSTNALAGSIVSAISVTGGSTIAITNNPISALTSANNGSFRGIYVSPLGATSNTITGNTINGMTSSSTGTGFSVRGIEVQGTNNATISANTISNITSPTTNVVLGAGTPIVGLYYGSSGAASTITGNTIFSINATATTAINVSASAIATGSTAGGGTITKNRIYGLTNTTTGATNASIGFLPNGGNWTFANNMISITNNNTVRAIGVFDAAAAGARNYYYNSIYIGGTHAGTQVSAAFQYNALAGATADIKNNIFVMERVSGAKNYAIANTAASFTGFTTNYNVLNCSVATTVGLSNTTDRDFSAWKTASAGDANSYSGIAVPFTNTATADLHLTATCTDIESGGTPLSVTDDYDSAARNATTPDIGADEFTGTRPADITLTPNSPLCNGSSINLNATSTDLTYAYTWSPVTGLSATTGASVTASPIITTTYTVTGTSPSTCVKMKEVTITVNPLPAPITVAPSTVNMCPNTIQMFTATPAVSTAVVGTDTGTSLSATTPYQQSALITSEVRTQYLITKAELNAAGMSAGNITSLGFTVKTVGVAAMPSYIISMANTLDTALTGTYISTGFSTVFTGTNILPVLGLNTHTFQTPFVWDGTSNVVINICHTSSGGGTLSGVAVSTFAVAMTNKRSGAAVCSVLVSIAGTSPIRPMMTIGFENPITWSPTTELYTDAAATIAYNPLLPAQANLATIYSKPTIPRVYTASSTNPITGCASTSTGTINMSASVWDGFSWTPSAPTGNTSLSFTGSYTSSGNLSGCSCTVTGGDVLFTGGVTPHSLILSGGLTVTAPGTLKFENNASLVQTDDTSTNSGIVTMERITPPIYRYDFTYWGTPMTLASNFTLGTGVNSLSPLTLSDKYFSWIPTVANAGGNWMNESITTVMDPRKGYCVRAPQTFSPFFATKVPYTANFVGTPNNGIISCPIYHGTLGTIGTPDDRDDWNLLGNPYPSAVSAALFLGETTNRLIIDGTIYFWTHNSAILLGAPNPFYGTFASNYNANDYASWNRVGPVGTAAGTGGSAPNGFIAAGQGFFAKSIGVEVAPLLIRPSPDNVIFNNSMRVVGNNTQFFRMNSIVNVAHQENNDNLERHRIWLDLINNGGVFNQILIGYVEGATLGLDREFDGVRFTDATSTTFYSVVENSKLVIQGRPLPFSETDVVPLGYRANVPDTFTFGLDHIDELFENQNIYIEDRDLNIIHNMKLSPYTFTSEAGTFNDRFVLRYTDAALGTDTFNTNPSVVAFIYNHELNIKSTKNITHIDLFDISGKLIKTYTNEYDVEFKTKFNFAQGVYLAKIRLDNGVEVTKKIVH